MKILRGLLLENIVIKITSLVLALLTWMYIASQLYREDLARHEDEAASIIEVSGEKLIVKRLPIYVNIEGSPAKDYEVVLDKVEVKPAYSVIAGPANVVKELSYIITEPINIEGASAKIRKNVRLTEVPKCRIGYGSPVSVVIPIAKQKYR